MFVSLLVGFFAALFGGALAGFISSKMSGSILGFIVWGAALLCGGLMGFALFTRNAKMPKNVLIGASVVFALVAMASMYYVLYSSSVTLKSGDILRASDMVSYPEFLSIMLEPVDLLFAALSVYVIYQTTKRIAPKDITA